MKALDFKTVRTPLIRFDERIFLKPENLQPFGSYKIRGVESVVRYADPERLSKGLSAASAGNMAQAVAFAAKTLGVPCRIFIPNSAPEIKKAAVRNLGAELVELPFSDIWDIVKGKKTPESGVFIHPVFTEDLLKGYESIAVELLEDEPELDAVVIPFGVGGLSLGCARALHRLKPGISVYVCEPETAAPMKKSLQERCPSSVVRIPSFVDAIGTPEVLPRVYDLLSPLIKDSVVVGLNEVTNAMRVLFQKHKLYCEGAAGAALAAAQELGEQRKYGKIACLLTGGNIAPELFPFK